MATEFKPLAFDDGANITVRIGSEPYEVTALDIQPVGIEFEYYDAFQNKTFRVFRPWHMVSSITQTLTGA